MTERQLNDLLRQLEQDPLFPLSSEQSRELAAHTGNKRVSEVLQFVKEQQETDRVLREQFSLLKEELSKLPVPAPPSADGLALPGSRNVLFYALPVAAMLVMAVTVFLWQTPGPFTRGDELALQVPEKQTEGGDGSAPGEARSEVAGEPAKNKQTAPVRKQEQLLAKKDSVSGGSEVFEMSGMADPSGSVMTRSMAPEFDSGSSGAPVTLSKEEQLKLRQKADELWKTVRQTPQDEKAKNELRHILERLGDKEGLRQLAMY